jgi:hypothetical protein
VLVLRSETVDSELSTVDSGIKLSAGAGKLTFGFKPPKGVKIVVAEAK